MAFIARLRGLCDTGTGNLTTNRARLWRCLYTDAGILTTFGAIFRFNRFSIPFRIGKMKISVNKIVDCKKLLPIKQPGSCIFR